MHSGLCMLMQICTWCIFCIAIFVYILMMQLMVMLWSENISMQRCGFFGANKNLYAPVSMTTFLRTRLVWYQIDVCAIWNYVYVDMLICTLNKCIYIEIFICLLYVWKTCHCCEMQAICRAIYRLTIIHTWQSDLLETGPMAYGANWPVLRLAWFAGNPSMSWLEWVRPPWNYATLLNKLNWFPLKWHADSQDLIVSLDRSQH